MKATLPSSPFPPQAFIDLADAEDQHWWFRARSQILIWILKTRVYGLSNFLEVGCGTGYVLRSISDALPCVGLEATEYFQDGMLIAMQRVPNCHFRQLDATEMAEADVYDCIGSFDVLEHIQADERVLLNFHRALRSGGFLVLTVPQHAWLWSGADEFAHHVRRYSRSELREKVLRAGFHIQECTSFVSILLPVMALQRLTASRKTYRLADELRINPIVNSMLYFVMQLEIVLLRAGLRFPAGGSLLLLARKP
ncbi:class I SAM-dependent methyltransferase [Synechococcus sp. CCY 0621]|uniref:class I SAM-dependent methyltransferase n=1 Tax=Synechococcus sp. CCY 0621 TaxID=2815603 RepID=UPI001C21A277|nr:class I SAM-dependent methyltransferase [Synechococcus sp. CCY 0621]